MKETRSQIGSEIMSFESLLSEFSECHRALSNEFLSRSLIDIKKTETSVLRFVFTLILDALALSHRYSMVFFI